MCGRYTVLTEREIIEIREILQEISLRIAKDEFGDYKERPGEIFPTNLAPVITSNRDGIFFESAKWGFKKWTGSGVIINARSETVKSVGMFKPHLNTGRCVVPAADFYEWQKLEKGKKKHYAKDKSGSLLFMAGLYRDTEEGREFAIITRASSGEMAAIHDRQPVILKIDQIEPWLSGALSPDDLPDIDCDLTVTPSEEGPDPNVQLSLWE